MGKIKAFPELENPFKEHVPVCFPPHYGTGTTTPNPAAGKGPITEIHTEGEGFAPPRDISTTPSCRGSLSPHPRQTQALDLGSSGCRSCHPMRSGQGNVCACKPLCDLCVPPARPATRVPVPADKRSLEFVHAAIYLPFFTTPPPHSLLPLSLSPSLR